MKEPTKLEGVDPKERDVLRILYAGRVDEFLAVVTHESGNGISNEKRQNNLAIPHDR